MANESMRYETIMIFNPTLGEEAVSGLVQKFKDLISEHGTIEKVEEWGKRRLAYPIEDEMDGYYVLIHFESKPDFPVELNRVFNITDGVLRTLVVRNEFEEPKEEPKEETPAPQPEAAAAPQEAATPAPAAPVQEPAPQQE